MNFVIWTIAAAIALSVPTWRYLTKRKFADGTPVLTDGHRASLTIINSMSAIGQGAAFHLSMSQPDDGIALSLFVLLVQGIFTAVVYGVVSDHYRQHAAQHDAEGISEGADA